jgi:hypothetical protein
MKTKINILLKNIQEGQSFYLLNKSGLPKYNGKMTFTMTRNTNGKMVEYSRIEKEKHYSESTMYDQYAVII